MATETNRFMRAHVPTRGLIGMLVIDRDAPLLPQVLQHLQAAVVMLCSDCIAPKSIHDMDIKCGVANDPKELCQCGGLCNIDLIVSAREIDNEARAAIQQHCPQRISHVEFLISNYDAHFSDHYHTDAVLEAICNQRNAIRNYALQDAQYDWLFFLDSDILLQPSTLILLLQTQRHCIGAPYMPRWSRHVVVGVSQIGESEIECNLQLLLNPHLLDCSMASIPCSILGFGAILIRSSLLHIPYRIQESIGSVKGEDIGFCIDLLALGRIDYQPYFLTAHYVEHLSGGASPSPFVPDLVHDQPLLTHIRVDQLFWVENNMSIEWQVQVQGFIVLSIVSHFKKQDQFTVTEHTVLYPATDLEVAGSVNMSLSSNNSDLQTIPSKNIHDPTNIEEAQTLYINEEPEKNFLRLLQRLRQERLTKRCPVPIILEPVDRLLTLDDGQRNAAHLKQS
ncbi:unnamed protein product [Rotaria sp. Silwood1]|nr:unnamed protein product [Rotaria sp. Silwood1]